MEPTTMPTATTTRTNADLTPAEMEVFKAIGSARADVISVSLFNVQNDPNGAAVADKAEELLTRLRNELAEFARNLPKNPAA